MLLLAAVIIAITGVILWMSSSGPINFNFFSAAPTPVQNPVAPAVTIDFSVFENALLKELQPFFQLPAYTGKIGVVNPFIK